MNTKLTLRMDEEVVRQAKKLASRRGKSVSRMFSEFVSFLGEKPTRRDLPPVTESLRGILKENPVSGDDYKKHLREKYL